MKQFEKEVKEIVDRLVKDVNVMVNHNKTSKVTMMFVDRTLPVEAFEKAVERFIERATK